MTVFRELIDRTILRMSQVPGAATQTYAEDRVAEMLQHKFDILFDEYWWPKYNLWSTYTLDGSTGVVTTDLTEIIKRFEDIRSVFIGNTSRRVLILGPEQNPNIIDGTDPRVYEANADAARVITIWPKTATGTLDINYQTKPDTFSSEDEVDMDDQLMICGAAWDYLEDDGTNPGATQKFQNFFEDRLAQLTSKLNSRPIPLDHFASRSDTFTLTRI